MSKSAAPKAEENVSPNLVPMIDIMFLLLLFLMLSADMGQRELEEVSLPKAVSVKEDKQLEKDDQERATVNIYHLYDVKCPAFTHEQVCREERHWRVGMKGVDYTEPERLQAILKKMGDPSRGRDPKNPQVSDLKVQIRADKSAPYGLAQRAMNTCAKVGIFKVEVGAALPLDVARAKDKETKAGH